MPFRGHLELERAEGHMPVGQTEDDTTELGTSGPVTYRYECPTYVWIVLGVACIFVVCLVFFRFSPSRPGGEGEDYVKLPDYPTAKNPQPLSSTSEGRADFGAFSSSPSSNPFASSTNAGAATAQSERIWIMLDKGAKDREKAFSELAAGRKLGHWIWWVFPALQAWGGDMFSAMQMEGGADLQSCGEAEGYLANSKLREAYLKALRLASAALDRHSTEAPYHVFDAAFGRAAQGAWLRGPVDSFKVRASATLFASAASKRGDEEIVEAAVRLLRHFNGDCVYRPDGEGSSGHLTGLPDADIPLLGPDVRVLHLCGVSWESLLHGN